MTDHSNGGRASGPRAVRPTIVYTIGHYQHTAAELTALLRAHHVTVLADVRSIPKSKRSPWFWKEQMEQWLPDAGIDYEYWPALGGRRPKAKNPTRANAGWENRSFRNYADHTLTPEWIDEFERFRSTSSAGTVAYMCGEPSPWRCHRSLISDSLVAHGFTVQHIGTTGRLTEHRLGGWGATPHVNPDTLQVTYPREEA